MVVIENLKFHQDLIVGLSKIIYLEFAHFFPHETEKDLEEVFKKRLNENFLPMTFVALENQKLVGTFSLRDNDAKIEKELTPPLKKAMTPWLGSVLVKENQRNKGIGKMLIERAKKEIKKLGYKELFLFTEKKEEFFSKLEFVTIQRSSLNGYAVAIMKCSIKYF